MRCPKCNKKMSETTDNSCLYYCKKCKIKLPMFAVDEEEKPTTTTKDTNYHWRNYFITLIKKGLKGLQEHSL